MQYTFKSTLHTIYNEYTYHLKISCVKTIVADVDVYTEKRPPLDIVAVVDRSGSMAGSQIRLVKDTLDFILCNLEEQDRFSLVSYASDVTVNYPLNWMNSWNVSDASRICESLEAKGKTYLSDGLYCGVNELMKNQRPGSIKAVLLLTDGQANVGHVSSVDINNHLDELLSSFKSQISIHTFGYGSDHSEDLLAKIAECGNGMYYYIQDVSKIGLAYTDCFGGLVSTIGINAKITVNLPLDVEVIVKGFQYKMIGNNQLEFNLRELQKDDERDIIISGTSKGIVKDRDFTARFECYNVVESHQDVKEIDTTISGVEENKDSEYQKIRIKTYEAMFNVLDNRTSALDIFNRFLNEIETSPVRYDQYVLEIVSEVNEIVSMINSNDNTVWKKIIQSAMSHKYQRSSGMDINSHKKYRSGAREIFKRNFNNRENHKKCHNCGADGHFAKECNKGEICHNCKLEGHRANQCPTGLVCHQCKKFGHLQQDCPTTICFNCGMNGHISRDCTKNPQNNQSQVYCFMCGKAGHFARDCPPRSVPQPQVVSSGCFHCGKAGHFARDCPQRGVPQPQVEKIFFPSPQNDSKKDKKDTKQDGVCYSCGIAGHKSRDCPQSASNNNKRGRRKK